MKRHFSYLGVVVFFLVLTILSYPVIANPLLNINSDQEIIYDSFEASRFSQEQNLGIKPYNYYKVVPYISDFQRLRNHLSAYRDTGYYWRPLDGLMAQYNHLGKDNLYALSAANQSGNQKLAGSNLYLSEEGHLSAGKDFVVYYQLKQQVNADKSDIRLQRGYAKYAFSKSAISFGIDDIALGPGYRGLIINNNSDPYPMLKINSQDFISIFGKWDFLFMHGWLTQNRDDDDNPRLMAAKLSYKPFTPFEIGGTRAVFYGGEDKKDYSFLQWGKAFWTNQDNQPGKHYNNKQFWAYDLTVFLPLNKIFDSIAVSKLYYEYGVSHYFNTIQSSGADAASEYEDLKQTGVIAGAFLSFADHIFRLEYSKTSKYFYAHNYYQQDGYSFRGLPLGHPFGDNNQGLEFSHRLFFGTDLSFVYRLGAFWFSERLNSELAAMSESKTSEEQAVETSKSHSYYLRFEPNYYFGKFILSAMLGFELQQSFDADPRPSNSILTSGQSTAWQIGFNVHYRL